MTAGVNWTYFPAINKTSVNCWKHPNGTAFCKDHNFTYVWDGKMLTPVGGAPPEGR